MYIFKIIEVTLSFKRRNQKEISGLVANVVAINTLADKNNILNNLKFLSPA